MKKILLLIAITLWGSYALAQSASSYSDYPNKPVKVVVSFPPGGASDVLARMIAQELSKELKQPFIVENRAGAGGLIGTLYGSKAAPDGYTLITNGRWTKRCGTRPRAQTHL